MSRIKNGEHREIKVIKAKQCSERAMKIQNADRRRYWWKSCVCVYGDPLSNFVKQISTEKIINKLCMHVLNSRHILNLWNSNKSADKKNAVLKNFKNWHVWQKEELKKVVESYLKARVICFTMRLPSSTFRCRNSKLSFKTGSESSDGKMMKLFVVLETAQAWSGDI